MTTMGADDFRLRFGAEIHAGSLKHILVSCGMDVTVYPVESAGLTTGIRTT
jgi:hypothetical protein